MERLWQVIVGPHLEADDAVDGLATAGQDNDPDPRLGPAVEGPAHAITPILPGQHQNEEANASVQDCLNPTACRRRHVRSHRGAVARQVF